MSTKIQKTTEQANSAQLVASIDDLLTQILLLLPILSLTRFKSVSKHWHSLITNPSFRLIRNPNPNPAVGLILPRTNYRLNSEHEYVPFSSTPVPSFRKLKFAKEPNGIKILQSCNGLLLCSSFRARELDTRYYVYNPTTKQYSTLPKLYRGYGNSMRVRTMNLAFDPVKSPHYKVICVRGSQSVSGEFENQVEVYSSEAGPWRVTGETFTEEVNFENGVYWNGSIHWIGGQHGGSFYFNIEDQVLETMPMPPIPDDGDFGTNYYFGESCDHLHYVEICGPQTEFNVFEMKNDYSGWFVKYRVDFLDVVDAYSEMQAGFETTDWGYYAYSVFCVVRGKDEEEAFLVLHTPGKVIRFNLVSQTFEMLHEFEGGVEVNDSLRFSGTSVYQLNHSVVFRLYK